MPAPVASSREALLSAADTLLAESPAEPLSVRAVCALAGVQFPTLYHFFVNKQGLIDAVAARGFSALVDQIESVSSPDVRGLLSAIWDAHIDAALNTPARYALMYGSTTIGSAPEGARRVDNATTTRLAGPVADGVLSTTAERAAWRLSTAAIGAALAMIGDPAAHPTLTDAARKGIITSLVRESAVAPTMQDHAEALDAALSGSDAAGTPLSPEEFAVFALWLRRLSATP